MSRVFVCPRAFFTVERKGWLVGCLMLLLTTKQNNSTLQHEACNHNHAPVVEALLQAGADVNVPGMPCWKECAGLLLARKY